MKWNNIGEEISSVDSLTLGYVLLMLVVSTIVYTSLAMYLESIIKTKHGVRKPWYFIFMVIVISYLFLLKLQMWSSLTSNKNARLILFSVIAFNMGFGEES